MNAVTDLRGGVVAALLAAGLALPVAAGHAAAKSKGVSVRECGRMSTPDGGKAWAYANAQYDCKRARQILHEWLFSGAAADLRGWRCYSATQAGQIVTCRRGSNRLHMQRTGHDGAKVKVD